jgi:hypothetical protein
MFKFKFFFTASALLIGIFVILSSVFFVNVSDYIINFVENNLSNDNNLEPLTEHEIRLNLLFFIAVGSLYSLFGFKKVRLKTFHFLNEFIDIDKVCLFLLSDKYTTKSHSYFSFALSSIIGLMLTLYFSFMGSPPGEGILESSTSVLFLISACVLMLSITESVFIKKNTQDRKAIVFSLAFLTAFMIFVFMEEFSWGQRAFNLESNDIFLTYNFQQEISFHNFFNPFFPLIYSSFGFSILLFSISSWFFSYPLKSRLKSIFDPHPSLIILILIMCSFSFSNEREFFEEFFAFFTVFYSTRIFLCIRYPST